MAIFGLKVLKQDALKHSRPARLRGLLLTAGSAALSLGVTSTASAQTNTDTAVTAPVETDGEDVTITSSGSVTLTTAGPAVIVNSSNALISDGRIAIQDVDNAIGVSLEGGAARSFTNRGAIVIDESVTPTNTDSDPFIDGLFAEGTGRTGILISGASPFEGNVELTSASNVTIEGNDSFGINLANTPMAMGGLTGNLTNDGAISVIGNNSRAINIAADMTGTLSNAGSIRLQGAGSNAFNIAGDIQGGFVNAGNVVNTGYRSSTRVGLSDSARGVPGRDTFSAEDLLQGGSAIDISGNISNGLWLEDRFVTVLDADGNPVLNDDGTEQTARVAISNITQTGSAPAILIDGQGTPIAIGVIAEITDPTADGFDPRLLYAFVNQGTVTANGIYDDIDATVFEIADATLTDGINNSGTLIASTFRAPAEVTDADGIDLTPGDGHARVIVLGDNALAQRINNTGQIFASASEAVDAIYADTDNVLASRQLFATAIDISATAELGSITNTGSISAVLIGRDGTAYAILDRSGTLININNTGTISAVGISSDVNGLQETNFNLVAIDVSANTTGVTIEQILAADDDPDDGFTPAPPSIAGDILLGSGDDSITSTIGSITGDIDFGAGSDVLSLSGTTYTGTISNSGDLAISLADSSTLTLDAATPLTATTITFDDTSSFRPTLNGRTGEASTLTTTGDISFATGATVSPLLTNIIGQDSTAFTVADAAGALTIGDLAALGAGETPFLYNTAYDQVGDTLVVTLTLRDPAVSVASGGLGLDLVQVAAFQTTLEALRGNTELGDAFSNITDSTGVEFNRAYNQLLPEFSAAARQFVIANVDGATGAVGSHLDTTRRSPDKPGGAWIEEFAYFADRDLAGLSEQYRGVGFGFTGGFDTALGPFHAVGVNFGFASTEIEDVVGIDEPLDVITLQAGLYAGWASGNLGVETYLGGGYNDFEQNRRVRVNDFSGNASGNWSGTHINGSVRAGYDMELSEKFWIRPAVSVDYLRLSEKAYSETGDAGVALSVDNRTSETGSATAMFNFGAKFQGRRTWIRPSLRAGYRYEFLNDPTQTNFRFVGLNDGVGGTFNSADALLQSALFPDSGFLVGFSIAAGSAYSSIGFDVDSEFRNGFVRHTGRVVIRLLF